MTERLNAIVGARIGEFRRKMAEARAIAMSFPKEIHTEIKVSQERFRKSMDKLADVYRDINTIGAEVFKGGLTAMVPVMVAAIPALIAVLATAGVQLGVMGGGLLGMASSAGLAGAAAVGFGAMLVPMITDLNKAYGEVKAGNKTLSDFPKYMRPAIFEMGEFKDQIQKTQKAMAPASYAAISGAIENMRVVINRVQDGLVGTAEAAKGLMDNLKNVINNAPDVAATFEWFNTRGPEAFSNWGKIAGYAVRGTLNLLRAFDPLAQTVEQGLLNMTQRFSEWAAGLSKSDKFKNFIDYVKENGPKLMDVFGDITVGIVNLFTAFAPLAADMMTGFQNLTQRFREWSASLSQNEGFKNFVNYIRENGPVMIDLIGNITNFLINLGKGFAAVGEFLAPLVNKFLAWSNSMMESHPYIAKIIAGITLLFGAFKMLAPIVIGLISVFGGTFSKLLAIFLPFKGAFMMGLRMLGADALRFVGKIAMMGGQVIMWLGRILTKAIVWAVRLAAQWLIAMGPVGWVIATVVALAALIIWKWDEIKAWTVKTWNMIAQWTSQKWSEITSYVTQKAAEIVTWVLQKWAEIKAATSAVWSAIKTFLASMWQSIVTNTITKIVEIAVGLANKWQQIKADTKQKISDIKNDIKQKFQEIKENIRQKIQETKENVRQKFQEIKEAIRTKVQEAKEAVREKFQEMKDTIRDKVQEAKETVKEKFREMYEAIKTKLEEILSAIKGIWEDILGFLREIPGKMVTIGGDIIQGLIDGILGMGRSAVEAITGVVGGVIEKAKGLLKSNSPSKVFIGLGNDTVDGLRIGIEKKSKDAINATKSMVNGVIKQGQGVRLAAPSIARGSMSQISVGVNTSKLNKIKPTIDAEYERKESDTYLAVDGRVLAQALKGHNKDIDKVDTIQMRQLQKLSAT